MLTWNLNGNRYSKWIGTMAKETKTKKEKPKPKSKYSNAGKGDKSRISDANKYAENWEKIFGKKKGDNNVN